MHLARSVAVSAALLFTATARADHWPTEHYVLAHQRDLPCEEIETRREMRTRYVMTFDRSGRLTLRDQPAGKNEQHLWQRYRYDERGKGGRSIFIEGVEIDGDRFHAEIRYDAAGRIQSVESHTTHTPDSSMGELSEIIAHSRKRPVLKPEEHVFTAKWTYEKDGVVRVHSVYDDKAQDGVERWVNGRIETAGAEPEVEVASYDDKGRLVAMQLRRHGRPDFVRRYTYDEASRLTHEEIVDPSGKVSTSHEYRYDCRPPH